MEDNSTSSKLLRQLSWASVVNNYTITSYSSLLLIVA